MSIVSVQILDGAMPDFELNGWRFLVQGVAVLPILFYRSCEFKVLVSKLGLMTFIIVLFLIYNVT